jgi:hypothetical protein
MSLAIMSAHPDGERFVDPEFPQKDDYGASVYWQLLIR